MGWVRVDLYSLIHIPQHDPNPTHDINDENFTRPVNLIQTQQKINILELTYK